MFKTMTGGAYVSAKQFNYAFSLDKGENADGWGQPVSLSLIEAVRGRWIQIQRPRFKATATTKNWWRRRAGDTVVEALLT